MTRYRYVTAERKGKWYNRLADAQAHANAVGAGFLAPDGTFIAYRGTILELTHEPPTAGCTVAESSKRNTLSSPPTFEF